MWRRILLCTVALGLAAAAATRPSTVQRDSANDGGKFPLFKQVRLRLRPRHLFAVLLLVEAVRQRACVRARVCDVCVFACVCMFGCVSVAYIYYM